MRWLGRRLSLGRSLTTPVYFLSCPPPRHPFHFSSYTSTVSLSSDKEYRIALVYDCCPYDLLALLLNKRQDFVTYRHRPLILSSAATHQTQLHNFVLRHYLRSIFGMVSFAPVIQTKHVMESLRPLKGILNKRAQSSLAPIECWSQPSLLLTRSRLLFRNTDRLAVRGGLQNHHAENHHAFVALGVKPEHVSRQT